MTSCVDSVELEKHEGRVVSYKQPPTALRLGFRHTAARRGTPCPGSEECDECFGVLSGVKGVNSIACYDGYLLSGHLRLHHLCV